MWLPQFKQKAIEVIRQWRRYLCASFNRERIGFRFLPKMKAFTLVFVMYLPLQRPDGSRREFSFEVWLGRFTIGFCGKPWARLSA